MVKQWKELSGKSKGSVVLPFFLGLRITLPVVMRGFLRSMRDILYTKFRIGRCGNRGNQKKSKKSETGS
tara:strand:- start:14 stop:220 length:207 start_codon:yes stop_codon:yes gene_type:complete